jgi:hypothetical protein
MRGCEDLIQLRLAIDADDDLVDVMREHKPHARF